MTDKEYFELVESTEQRNDEIEFFDWTNEAFIEPKTISYAGYELSKHG